MGDRNAVDVAHEVHRRVLESEGGLAKDSDVIYGHLFPRGPLYEGAYIDDHFVLAVSALADINKATGPDFDLIRHSHLVYVDANLPRAVE